MGKRKKRTNFGNSSKSGWPQVEINSLTYDFYYDRLKNLSINAIEWEGLPEEIDERFLELSLFDNGNALFFYDDIVGRFITLPAALHGPMNIYNVPRNRRAYAVNGYNYSATDKNSVIIFNNYLRQPGFLGAQFYAMKLYELERTQDVNIKGQKFPVLVKGSEKQRLSMLNLYEQYDGNCPFIFGDEKLNPEQFQVLNTNSPFVADKIQILKQQIWKEALLYYGIDTQVVKPERLTVLESAGNIGTIEAERFVRLNARRQAAEEINSMFGLDIWPKYRYETLTDYGQLDTLEGATNE